MTNLYYNRQIYYRNTTKKILYRYRVLVLFYLFITALLTSKCTTEQLVKARALEPFVWCLESVKPVEDIKNNVVLIILCKQLLLLVFYVL